MIWLGLLEMAVAGEACPPCESRTAVGAIHDVPMGAVFTAGDFVSVSGVLPSELPADTLGQPELVVGRVARVHILAGQWVREAHFVDVEMSSPSTLVPLGMRALALPIDAPAGVQPGSRVDLIWASPGQPACQLVSVLPVLGIRTASPLLVLALTPEQVAVVGPVDPAQLEVVGRNERDVFTDVIAPCPQSAKTFVNP